MERNRDRSSRSKSRSPQGVLGEWGEDCIDIHAMDDDMYATDVGEEDPLARIFPAMKPSKKPQQNTAPPVGSRLDQTPCNLDLSSQDTFVFKNGELRRKSVMVPAAVERSSPQQAPVVGVHARLGKSVAVGPTSCPGKEVSLERRNNASPRAASVSGRSSPSTPSTPAGDNPLFFPGHLG